MINIIVSNEDYHHLGIKTNVTLLKEFLINLYSIPMCFSAEASFGASAVLFGVGCLTISRVQEIRQLPFATIPFIFSIQQFFEGLLWLALKNQEYQQWQNLGTQTFLIFAQIIWPLWVPTSILLLEKKHARIKILSIFSGIGFRLCQC